MPEAQLFPTESFDTAAPTADTAAVGDPAAPVTGEQPIDQQTIHDVDQMPVGWNQYKDAGEQPKLQSEDESADPANIKWNQFTTGPNARPTVAEHNAEVPAETPRRGLIRRMGDTVVRGAVLATAQFGSPESARKDQEARIANRAAKKVNKVEAADKRQERYQKVADAAAETTTTGTGEAKGQQKLELKTDTEIAEDKATKELEKRAQERLNADPELGAKLYVARRLHKSLYLMSEKEIVMQMIRNEDRAKQAEIDRKAEEARAAEQAETERAQKELNAKHIAFGAKLRKTYANGIDGFKDMDPDEQMRLLAEAALEDLKRHEAQKEFDRELGQRVLESQREGLGLDAAASEGTLYDLFGDRYDDIYQMLKAKDQDEKDDKRDQRGSRGSARPADNRPRGGSPRGQAQPRNGQPHVVTNRP